MAAPLTTDERAHYTRIVDGILATADLQTVTRKKIRQGLEKALGGKDLDDQKDAIKKLIEERFDAISENEPPAPAAAAPVPLAMPLTMPAPPSPPPTKANGYSPETDSNGTNGEIRVSLPTPKRKRDDSEDADAKLAAMLQEQEDSLGRARKTRGGGTAKPNKKKAPKKKSKATVDDSDVEASGEEGAVKKRKAGGGFSKPFNLSPALTDLCGEETLPRPQVVKKIWEHIRAEKLQDPADKRNIICDDKMQAVFKQSKISMFQMNKHLGNHLYPVEPTEAS